MKKKTLRTYYLFCAFFFYYISSASAAGTENCELRNDATEKQWSQIHVPYELKPANVNVTVGSNIADWMVLYTIHANIGMAVGECNNSDTRMYFTILSNEQPISKQGNDYIYKTDVSGIGMSVASDGGGYTGLQTYPTLVLYGQPKPQAAGDPFWATIKFWKIPGEPIPMRGGAITVTGPDAAAIYSNSGNTFTSSQSERITSDGKGYINTSRILTGTLIFQPGTCNIEGDNIRVDMGNDLSAGDKYGAWKDASFRLNCPNGYGYQGKATSSDQNDYPYSLDPHATINDNTVQNGQVRISILPYTQIIDGTKGIIALDGTGAQGYGIQLVWGDYSQQDSDEPDKPVILNSYIYASELNSGFRAGATPLSKNAFTGGDNTIKMAARYIRTSGLAMGGPANAAVEVVATYE